MEIIVLRTKASCLNSQLIQAGMYGDQFLPQNAVFYHQHFCCTGTGGNTRRSIQSYHAEEQRYSNESANDSEFWSDPLFFNESE